MSGGSLAQRIQAIKSGAHREAAVELVGGLEKGGANQFEELKVTKPDSRKRNMQQRQRPGQQNEPERKVTVPVIKTASVGDTSLFNDMEAMITGESRPFTPEIKSSKSKNGQQVPQIQYNKMPDFNPAEAKRKAIERADKNVMLKFAQPKPLPGFDGFEGNYAPITATEDFVEEQYENPTSQIDINALKTMMESIAKGMVHKEMKTVLDSYLGTKKTAQVSNNVCFEYYNKSKAGDTILKGPKDQLYKMISEGAQIRLVPVKIAGR